MQAITRYEIEPMLQIEEWPAVSIYMPISRIGDPQDSIRYKNLLSLTDEKLTRQGLPTREVRNLLAAEYDRVKDAEYWKHLGQDGLAVFLAGQTVFHYSLPVSFAELVIVGTRFQLRPLLPLLTGGSYLVLALSKKKLQLFQGDRYQLVEIDLPEDTPKSIDEALKYDDPERQLQYHTKTASPGSGERGAMFHGHGVGIDDQDSNLERYFQAIDRTLFPYLEHKELPVILAGTEELHAVYRGISKSHTLLSAGIKGNVSELAAETLQARAWEIAGDYFAEEEKATLQKFQDNIGSNRVTDDLQSLMLAASDGRVESLFIAENEQLWGTVDIDTRKVKIKNEEERKTVNLIDEAVSLTLNKKGRVYIKKRQEMPLDVVMCAQLRY